MICASCYLGYGVPIAVMTSDDLPMLFICNCMVFPCNLTDLSLNDMFHLRVELHTKAEFKGKSKFSVIKVESKDWRWN